MSGGRNFFRHGIGVGLAVLLFHCALPLRGQPFGGIVAYQLTFSGNNVTCDSFDSSSPAHSIWQTNVLFHGQPYGVWSNSLSYDPNFPPSRTANFHLASETNFIDVGNAMIYGYLHATPGGVYSIRANGSVGDFAWVHNGNYGLEPGHFNDTINQVFMSLPLPVPTNSFQSKWFSVTTYTNVAQTNGPSNAPWFWVTKGAAVTNFIRIGSVYSNQVLIGSGTVYTNINNTGWMLPNGDGTFSTYDKVILNRPEATNYIYYSASSLTDLYVDAPNTILYLTNGMNSPIIILNTNADLTIYSGGDITFGTTINNTQLARALTICDIRGNPITITASGNSILYSKFYVPSSSLRFNGGGHNTYDIVGEINCYSLSINGYFNFHFDESLGAHIPPGIISGPTNLLVQAGSNATFNVLAGLIPLNYQWFDNQTNPIAFGTNSSLTLTNIRLSNTGNYSIIITNLYGAVTSSASLTVFTNATAALNNFSINSSGSFQFYNQGVTGLTYTIQASTDLVNWVPLWTNVSPFTFTDTNVLPQRFYRSVYFP